MSTTAAAVGALGDTFTTSIQVQKDAVTAANNAIPALLAYKNNALNPADKRALADASYQSAVTTRDKALSDIPKLTAMQNEYVALKAEEADPKTTVERKQAIAQRVSTLQAEFLQLNPLSRSALDSLINSWKPPA